MVRRMRLEDLTVSQVADMILEQYEKKYVKPRMTEMRAAALLIVNGRRIKPEFKLAKAYAADYIFKTATKQQKKVLRSQLRYKRILTLPSTVKVLMIPRWERFELLRSHPKFKKLIK